MADKHLVGNKGIAEKLLKLRTAAILKKVAIIFFMISLVRIGLAGETLPPYHWANNYIDYLKVRGYLPELSFIDRPFERHEIGRQLLQINWDILEERPKDKEIVETLYGEFANEIKFLNETEGEKLNPLLEEALKRLKVAFTPEYSAPYIKTGAFGLGSTLYSDDKEDAEGDFDFHTQLGLFWKDRLILYNNMKVFRKTEPTYIGKEFRGLHAYTEQAYLAYRWNWGQFKIGRDFMQIGAGRSGQLLISDNSRTFDMYKVLIGKKFFQYSFWGFFLDRRSIVNPQLKTFSNTANRYLNGHRLSVNIGNKVFVGISEVLLYGGPNRGWEMGVMNPFMIYYGYVVNTPNFTGNSLLSIDWDLYLFPNLEIYGEFLIDDFQVDKKEPGDLEPNELGFIGGIQWADPFNLSGSMFHAEYVQVRNRTYNVPSNDWEKYLHRNEVIGYYLGNNFMRYGIAASYWTLPDMRIKLFANLIRQGEGSVHGEFNTDFLNYTVEEGYNEPFPWGVVERHTQSGISIFYKPHRLAHFSGEITYNDFKNYLNQNGERFSELSVNLSLWLQWDRLWEFIK